MARLAVTFAVGWTDRAKVAAQCFQGDALLFDLPRRAIAKPPQDRNGRAPSLHGVLQEKSADQSRQSQPAPIAQDTEYRSKDGQRGGIGFKDPFDIPFLIKLTQPAADPVRMFGEKPHPRGGLLLDPAIDLFGGVGG